MNDTQQLEEERYLPDEERISVHFSEETSSSSDSSENNSENSEDDSDDEDDLEDDDRWYEESLYENLETTLGEAVLDVLEVYIKNKQTKRSLYHILSVMYKHLPKPNNLPKSKYHLSKMLNTLLPMDEKFFEKYRICEDCSYFLGKWSFRNGQIICENPRCNSKNTNGAYFHFDLGSHIKNLFENSNLAELLTRHRIESPPVQNYISDVTSGSQYKIWKKEVITNDYDLCLQFNMDGTPLKKSSKSQVWLIPSQIINISVKNRRNFQFVSGIYYTRQKNQ